MKELAYLFSGTGSQTVGMGHELYKSFPEFRHVYECAGDLFHFNVAKLAFEGTVDEISATAVSHRLIYAMSMGVYEVVKTRLPKPTVFAGHSLGEIAALTACGVFSFEQGFTVLYWRSQLLEEAGQKLCGAMYAIVGAAAQSIENACRCSGGFVLPVNYNSPTQTVISGDTAAAKAAAALLQQQGARVIPLNVTVPFHTIRLQDAADRLRERLQTLPAPAAPIGRFFCNITGQEKTNFSDLPDYLARQMVSPVRFTDELTAICAAGVDAYLELGPGKVLTGLVKKTLKGSLACNVDTPAALEKAAAQLGL